MKKQKHYLFKKPHILALVIMLLFSLFTPIEKANAYSTFKYLGAISDSRGTYGWAKVGNFQVDGRQAYCLEHKKSTPGNGVSFIESIYNDERLEKALYYGYGGIEPWNGFKNTNNGIVVTSLALSVIYNGWDSVGGQTTGNKELGVMDFLNFIDQQEDINKEFYFTPSKVSAKISADETKQITDTMTMFGDNNVTITLPNDVSMVKNGTSYTGTVTIYGGESFYFEAPLSMTGIWEKDAIKGNAPDYQAIVLKPTSSSLQDIGSLKVITNPDITASFSVDWIDYQQPSIKSTNASTSGNDEGTVIFNKIDATTGNGLSDVTVSIYCDNQLIGRHLVTDRNGQIAASWSKAYTAKSDEFYYVENWSKISPENKEKYAHYYKDYASAQLAAKKQANERLNALIENATYTFKAVEEKAKAGYILDTSKNTISKTSKDNTVYLSLENQAQYGKIEIIKKGEVLTDFKNNQFVYEEKGLKDAKYQIIAKEDIYLADQSKILYKSGTVVETITTNDEGIATSSSLPLGTYLIKEIQAPKGYVINSQVQEISLTYDKQLTSLITHSLVFSNQRQKLDISAFKTDSLTGTGLKNAKFTIYNTNDIITYDGKVLFKANSKLETIKTEADGDGKFTLDLPLGSYEIKEEKAPKGYASTNQSIQIDGNNKDDSTLVYTKKAHFKNDITQVEISKKDASTNEELPGASLILKDVNGNIVEEWISTKKPHIIKGLEVNQQYTLIEKSHPKGFTLSNEITFTVKDTGEVQKIEMIDNLKVGKVQFIKYGEAYINHKLIQTNYGTAHLPSFESSKLSGSALTIYAAEDIVLGNGKTYFKKDDVVQVLTSSSDITESEPLLVGKYYAKETKAPDGYIQDYTKYDFEIVDNGSKEIQLFKLKLLNERTKFNIDLTKILEKDLYQHSKAYKDVIFGIYTRDDLFTDNLILDIPKDTLIAISNIDENGKLTNIPDLPLGNYYLKELATNKHYQLDHNTYDFSIVDQKDNVIEYIIEINNGQEIINSLKRTSIKITKIAAEDEKRFLAGASFTLYDENMQPLSTIQTNQEGIALFEHIEHGVYYLQETKAPIGYQLNNELLEIVIDENYNSESIYEITLTNILTPIQKTGDNANILLYFSSALIALGVVFILKMKK